MVELEELVECIFILTRGVCKNLCSGCHFLGLFLYWRVLLSAGMLMFLLQSSPA